MANILVIDDSNSSRFMIAQALQQAGHQVREASNGAEGIAVYIEGGIDLVITDLSMPIKDGISVITELKAESQGIKIIGISGRASNYLALAKHLGAARIFTKPIDFNGLLSAISELTNTA